MTDSDSAAVRGGAAATEPTHAAFRDLLADYATAAALGADPESAYPAIAAHLEGCADCRASLQGLLELMADAFAGRIAPAPSYGHPDLSFLFMEQDGAATRDLPGRA